MIFIGKVVDIWAIMIGPKCKNYSFVICGKN
jgi:hypothetical protein